MKKLLCWICASISACVVLADEKLQTGIVPTAAVLHFEARDRAAANANMGKSVAELLNLALQESGAVEFVERAVLDKALDELHLSAVGLTDQPSQVKLGRLIGAKILLTGSLFKSGDKNFVVVKIIGTETSRVLGASISGTKDFTLLVPELAPKVAAILEKQSSKLLPKPKSVVSAAEVLKSAVNGKQRKIAITVKEDIHSSSPGSAAETELKKLLLALNFRIVEKPEDADFVVHCKAAASNAGMYHKFTSASARVELAIYASGKRLLASGSVKETRAGASYDIAAKDAVAQAALHLAIELFGVLK